jgi:hypothetical protein
MNIQSFSTWEEAVDAMGEAEDAANEALSGAQKLMRDAEGEQYVLRLGPEDVLIYGSIPPAADIELRDRGYLTGTWFSAWEPKGEYGDGHVADCMYSIPPSLFEEAKALGWPTVEEIRRLARSLPDYLRFARKLAMAEAFAAAQG